MKYINKNTGDIIVGEVYFQLSEEARDNYIYVRDTAKPVEKTVINHTTVIKDDHISLGDVAVASVAIPAAILWSIFD